MIYSDAISFFSCQHIKHHFGVIFFLLSDLPMIKACFFLFLVLYVKVFISRFAYLFFREAFVVALPWIFSTSVFFDFLFAYFLC